MFPSSHVLLSSDPLVDSFNCFDLTQIFPPSSTLGQNLSLYHLLPSGQTPSIYHLNPGQVRASLNYLSSLIEFARVHGSCLTQGQCRESAENLSHLNVSGSWRPAHTFILNFAPHVPTGSDHTSTLLQGLITASRSPRECNLNNLLVHTIKVCFLFVLTSIVRSSNQGPRL